ncbi:MAG: gliding motility protein GldG [Myxococcaceae bacterium]|nr:gliding motility protein GldG [Myxococcaceae bacterium]
MGEPSASFDLSSAPWKDARVRTTLYVLGALIGAWLSFLFVSCVRLDREVAVAPPAPSRSSASIVAECAGAKDVAAALPVDINVEIYATRRLPVIARFVRRIEEELAPYRAVAGGRIHVMVADTDDAAVLARAREAGVDYIKVNEEGHVDWNTGKERAFLGVVFTYGKACQTIESIDPDAPANIGLAIYLRLRTLRDRAEMTTHRIGVLGGHGEPPLDEPIVPRALGGQSIATQVAEALPTFRLVDVDLRKQAIIDPSLEGLIVLQPTRDLSTEDLRAIDQFVMRGRSLVVAASSVSLRGADLGMMADLNAHGLEQLLHGYGIELARNVVIDRTHSFAPQEGEPRLPALILAAEEPGASGGESGLRTLSLPLWRTKRLALPFASSLTVVPSAQPDATLRVLATSSSTAEVETGSTYDLSPARAWGPASKQRQVDLIASSEGKLTSAFGKEKAARPARVLAIASAGVWRNPFGVRDEEGSAVAPDARREKLDALWSFYARAGLVNDALFFFRNTLFWMATDPLVLACTWALAARP